MKELAEISRLTDTLKQLDAEIHRAQARYSFTKADFEMRCSTLSMPPEVTYPTLKSKIEDSLQPPLPPKEP